MGNAYADLLTDRTLLLGRLQAYVASDPDVRALVREGFKGLTGFVADAWVPTPTRSVGSSRRGCHERRGRDGVDRVDEPWARDLMVHKKGVK